jgi:hypothetical protein
LFATEYRFLIIFTLQAKTAKRDIKSPKTEDESNDDDMQVLKNPKAQFTTLIKLTPSSSKTKYVYFLSNVANGFYKNPISGPLVSATKSRMVKCPVVS